MNRNDVAIVGPVDDKLCLLCLLRSDIIDPRLYVYCLSDNGPIASIGYIGSSVSGRIGVYRPLYVKPTLISGSDCSSITVNIESFQDTDANISMGFLDSNCIPRNSKTDIILTTTDPCSTSQLGIMSSVRYEISGLMLPGTECIQSTNELCLQNINAINLASYPFYLMFIPLNYYSSEGCLDVSRMLGFSPISAVYTQCKIFPNSVFGNSNLCNDVVAGFTQYQYCGSEIFSYGYPGSDCGNDVTYVNLLQEEVSAVGSGLCDNELFCKGVGDLSCQRGFDNVPSLPDNDDSYSNLIPIVIFIILAVIVAGGAFLVVNKK